MNRSGWLKTGFVLLVLCCSNAGQKLCAQGLHFSQYYNAPMLLNAANTALMAENDYRIGSNYRGQWGSVPVPYRTFSLYGDFQALRNRNETNWLGVGLAFFSDRAGNGDLALNRSEAFLAYHIGMGQSSMLSFGLSGATVTRSVDYSKLTFDQQWDGFAFNGTLPNGEKAGMIKTKYLDVGAGINLAVFPNEAVYLKFGAGMAHINTPKESFYGMIHDIGMRPTGNIDAQFKMQGGFILNPSLYYTSQKGGSELVFGSLYDIFLTGGDDDGIATRLILGTYYRWNDAAIGVVGLDWNGFRVMTSYDVTVSKLSAYNRSQGAFELSVQWQGRYGNTSNNRGAWGCPRF